MSLRISRDELAPDEISNLLGVPSTYSEKKGDVIVGKVTKNQRIAKTGRWSIVSILPDAVDQSVVRDISVPEMEQAILDDSLIIEDYPNDKYGPSCLILGYTLNRRPLHVQCSYPYRPLIKIITLYQPDPELWIDDRIRKSK